MVRLFSVYCCLMFITLCRLISFAYVLDCINTDLKCYCKIQCNRYLQHFYSLVILSFEIKGVCEFAPRALIVSCTPMLPLSTAVRQSSKSKWSSVGWHSALGRIVDISSLQCVHIFRLWDRLCPEEPTAFYISFLFVYYSAALVLLKALRRRNALKGFGMWIMHFTFIVHLLDVRGNDDRSSNSGSSKIKVHYIFISTWD